MVFIVAEIGVNWHGNIDAAKFMIYAAWKNGADAVKFQFFREEEIQHVTDESVKKELLSMILDYEKAKELKEWADKVGVTWFATPMYPEAIDTLESLGVTMYKIRHKDRNNNKLIAKAVATKKPVLISTDEPRTQIQSNTHYLYCVPKYPTTYEDLNLTMLNLRSFQGFSSHLSNPNLCIAIATLLSASRGINYVLEVHVKQDDDNDCIDNAVSLPMSILRDLVGNINEIEQAFKHTEAKGIWNMW